MPKPTKKKKPDLAREIAEAVFSECPLQTAFIGAASVDIDSIRLSQLTATIRRVLKRHERRKGR